MPVQNDEGAGPKTRPSAAEMLPCYQLPLAGQAPLLLPLGTVHVRS
jgi:hypothetical protein